ncbi:hypothetical protein, conserved in T. vivax [Trypanosoma vivax Y486]|uniref:Uncharacterized protein n=1 Tax=Trypanosoma vivax (strain Y486) TaxID=1055687 RepID=F9WLM1_TRYVY|nr:hypothetical protein, conserved in T. vivax [Trypanosoma vivax Y486]|eukprot:CCD18413.1 hypothetical protein, conserved in T. vivax [Trypanosoma vivax Y486]
MRSNALSAVSALHSCVTSPSVSQACLAHAFSMRCFSASWRCMRSPNPSSGPFASLSVLPPTHVAVGDWLSAVVLMSQRPAQRTGTPFLRPVPLVVHASVTCVSVVHGDVASVCWPPPLTAPKSAVPGLVFARVSTAFSRRWCVLLQVCAHCSLNAVLPFSTAAAHNVVSFCASKKHPASSVTAVAPVPLVPDFTALSVLSALSQKMFAPGLSAEAMRQATFPAVVPAASPLCFANV